MPRNNKQNKQMAVMAKKRKGGKGKVKVVNGSGAYSFKDMGGAIKSAVQGALKNKSTRSMLINGAGSLADRFVPGSKNAAAGLAKLLLNKVSGSGAYMMGGHPRVNSLFKNGDSGKMASGNALSIPKMHDSGNSIRVSHREYIMDILAPSDGEQFNPMVFSVNPGDPAVFPYLSGMAQLFEQYKFHGLVFEFVSTTSPYNSSPAMGYVMAAAQYNVLQAPFQSPIELENSTDSIMARPDNCIMYGVECATQSYNYYYVENNRNVVIDPATYNFMNFTLATKGLPATYLPGSVLGQLWVSFDIELLQPLYELPAGGSCILAANPLNTTSTTNFLAAFKSTGGHTNSLNYNGRFTPYALNGSGKPLISTSDFNDGSHTQTRLVVELGNMESGNGVLVQLTTQCDHITTTTTSPTPVAISASTANTFGNSVTLQENLSFQITGMVNCELQNFDPYMTLVTNVHNNMKTLVRGKSTVAPFSCEVQQTVTSSGNNRVQVTFSWYVVMTGSNPGFMISPATLWSDRIPVKLGTTTSNWNLNMTLIKDTNAIGTPTFIPYYVAAGTPPTTHNPTQSNSMAFHRTFSQKYAVREAQERDDRTLLKMLCDKHGISISSIHEEAPDRSYADVDSEDETYDCAVAPKVPLLERVRSMSLSASSKF